MICSESYIIKGIKLGAYGKRGQLVKHSVFHDSSVCDEELNSFESLYLFLRF